MEQPARSPWKPKFALVPMAMAVGVLALFSGGSTRGTPVRGSQAQQMAECPTYEGDRDPVSPDVGPIGGIPEFHDCQRFYTGGHYNGLFAIYSLYEQDSVWENLQTKGAVLAGVIRALDEAYPPLGIKKGYNCLYLFFQAANVLKARVQPNPTSDCPDAPPTTPGGLPPFMGGGGGAGTMLAVNRVSVPGFSAKDYPMAARWGRQNNGTYYMEVMCNASCEIGVAGFAANPAYPSAALPAALMARRVSEIKGWFDEQELAVSASGTIGGTDLVPSERGTVFPHPGLGGYTMSTFVIGTWVPAAYVALHKKLTPYFAKFSFVQAPITTPLNLHSLNELSLCHGTQSDCHVPSSVVCTWPAGMVPGDTNWWVKIQLGASIGYSCVVRRDHSSLTKTIPGTARWRWQAADETLWVRCAQGCCEVH